MYTTITQASIEQSIKDAKRLIRLEWKHEINRYDLPLKIIFSGWYIRLSSDNKRHQIVLPYEIIDTKDDFRLETGQRTINLGA